MRRNSVLICFENEIINIKIISRLRIKLEKENFIILVLNDAHQNLKIKN